LTLPTQMTQAAAAKVQEARDEQRAAEEQRAA